MMLFLDSPPDDFWISFSNGQLHYHKPKKGFVFDCPGPLGYLFGQTSHHMWASYVQRILLRGKYFCLVCDIYLTMYVMSVRNILWLQSAQYSKLEKADILELTVKYLKDTEKQHMAGLCMVCAYFYMELLKLFCLEMCVI